MQPYKRLIIVHHEPSRKMSDFRQITVTDKTAVHCPTDLIDRTLLISLQQATLSLSRSDALGNIKALQYGLVSISCPEWK